MEQLELMTAIIKSNPGINLEDAWKMHRELVIRVHALHSRLKSGDRPTLPKPSSNEQSSYYSKQATEIVTIGDTTMILRGVRAKDYVTLMKAAGYSAEEALASLNPKSKFTRQVAKAQKAREKKLEDSGKAPVKVPKSKKAATTE